MGLMNIQAYHGLDPSDIIDGRIRYGDKVYQSKTKLTIEDAKLIAEEAKKSKRLNVQIQWLNQTVTYPSRECKLDTDTAKCDLSDKEINPSISGDNAYIKATKEHDKALVNWEKTLLGKISTFKDPINADAPQKAHEFRHHFDREMGATCGNPKIVSTCSEVYQFHRIQNLCSDPNHTSPPRPENICANIHYRDSYLKLGPFKLEHLNSDPVVQVVHNFVHKNEKDLLYSEFKDKMITSSLTYVLEDTESYRSIRANEAYISEYSTPGLIKLGNRIELATAFNVFNPNYRYVYVRKQRWQQL